MTADALRIGLIADTHGLLRPQAMSALQGVDQIWHAGDIGAPTILETLRSVAPVYAVRGNNDTAPWAHALPDRCQADVGGLAMLMIHDLNSLEAPLPDATVRIVVAGHSHRPSVTVRDGVLFINPGSAGPRRFRLPVSVAMLEIHGGEASASVLILDV